MKQRDIWAGVFSLMVILSGCMSVLSGSVVEPPIIMIRNGCARDLSRVVLKEPRVDGQPVSMGSVSPVLRSSPFVYRRPSNPPPLLRTLKVVWTEAGGATFQETVTLDAVLRQATGEPDEALVFHIQPGSRVSVTLERLGNSPR